MAADGNTSMIERVAKAIGDGLDGYVDATDTPNTWARSLTLARAAIAAMREPSDGMLKAGDAAPTLEVIDVWHAMIDAAISSSVPATSGPSGLDMPDLG